MTNPKHEYLNTKQILITKIQIFKTMSLEFRSFGFRYCLGFRY